MYMKWGGRTEVSSPLVTYVRNLTEMEETLAMSIDKPILSEYSCADMESENSPQRAQNAGDLLFRNLSAGWQ